MNKKLYRSKTDKKIAGVCGGLAKCFNIDAKVLRIITVVISLFYGIGLIAYIVAAVLVPEDPGEVIDYSYPEEPYAPKATPTESQPPKLPKMPKVPKTPGSFGSSGSSEGGSGNSNSNSNTNNFKKY